MPETDGGRCLGQVLLQVEVHVLVHLNAESFDGNGELLQLYP